MTCANHAWPIAGCVGCLGRWDRAMAEAVLADLYGIEAATLRAALAEIDRLQVHLGAISGEHADGTPCMECEARFLLTKVREQRAEIDALRCGDLYAFWDPGLFGKLSSDRADAFREHLGRCERCSSKLHELMQESTTIAQLVRGQPR